MTKQQWTVKLFDKGNCFSTLFFDTEREAKKEVAEWNQCPNLRYSAMWAKVVPSDEIDLKQFAGRTIADIRLAKNDKQYFLTVSFADGAKLAVTTTESNCGTVLSIQEVPAPKPEVSDVIQTSCRYCGLDIESFSPYPKGQWRDRGNNTICPGDGSTRLHAPSADSRFKPKPEVL